MNNGDYCSYELSKALKECGFDSDCFYYYTKRYSDNEVVCIPSKESSADYNKMPGDVCSMPTLWQAQKWLRGKGIAVSVQANEIQGELWYSSDIITTKGINELVDGGFDYMGYEAALSAGIAAALEIIIKRKKNG